MAFQIKTTWFNGYRCSCCLSTYKSDRWVQTLDEALLELPNEFPSEDDGGDISITIKDGSTGEVVASSEVSFAPVWQRGDGYKYTMWTLYINGEAAPGRGTFTCQIIEGVNVQPRHGKERDVAPLKLITDRTWSQLCDELAEGKRQRDIAAAKADKAMRG